MQMDTDSHINQILKTVFGYEQLRTGQAEIMHHILSATHVLAVMPTGAGKSLCFQIPALIQPTKTLVVSPLVALIEDQTNALQEIGVPAVCIHSGKTRDENVISWKNFISDTGKILYLSPERLMQDRMLHALQKHNIGMIVIDEAHCISKWGPTFRPDYESLTQLQSYFPNATICGFTATADTATRTDIAQKLFQGNGEIIVKGFNRPNLSLAVQLKHRFNKSLLEYVQQRQGQNGIIYCLSRKNTDTIAQYLNDNGIRAVAYHAGKPADERTSLQNKFMTDSDLVMVATIAFGMGIDKPDIRFVIHANLPSSMEAFYQEIGRAGRDGEPSETVLFYDLTDIIHRQRMIFEQNASNTHKVAENARLQALIGYAETAECRRKVLLRYFDDYIDHCGNCDNCLYPPSLQDCTEQAIHILQAVEQTKQYFGATYIIDIIRGSKNQNIRDFHLNLPCFGIGADTPKYIYQTIIRQLIAQGYLNIDFNKYGAIKHHKSSQNILNGTKKFKIAIPQKKPAKTEKQTKIKATESQVKNDHALFTQLKALRLDLAREKQVPAFVIFADKTLIDMTNKKPITQKQFLEVHGIGTQKLKTYYDVFCTVIKEYLGENEG